MNRTLPRVAPSLRVSRLAPPALLWAAIAAYAVTFSALGLARHARLGSSIFDLGIFDQAVWLIAHGRAPYLTTRGMHARMLAQGPSTLLPLASIDSAALARGNEGHAKRGGLP